MADDSEIRTKLGKDGVWQQYSVTAPNTELDADALAERTVAADLAQSAPSAERYAELKEFANHKISKFGTDGRVQLPAYKLIAILIRLEQAETRAETAESALRQIVGNVDLKQLLEWLDFELSGTPDSNYQQPNDARQSGRNGARRLYIALTVHLLRKNKSGRSDTGGKVK